MGFATIERPKKGRSSIDIAMSIELRPPFPAFIGAGGRRLWTVKVELDPPNVMYIDLPEAEMKAVQ